jgi:hypothetical protein
MDVKPWQRMTVNSLVFSMLFEGPGATAMPPWVLYD